MAAVLPDEAPRATRLLGCDDAALEHRELQAAFGELPGRAAPDDAAADDRDIDAVESVQRGTHPRTPLNTRRKLPPRILAVSSSEKSRRRSAAGMAAKSSTTPKPSA